MGNRKEKEEYLEKLWYMKEEAVDTLEDFKGRMGEVYKEEILREIVAEGMAELSQDGSRIALTKEGKAAARRLIRAHRLAERLIYDALGGKFEKGACEFEHVMALELVDSVCTLLGHPRECPHGLPIPEGDCCKKKTEAVRSPITPLIKLKVGQSARVAYVNCRDDRLLHKIDGLHIRPGAVVKLHQVYPTVVIECEDANIAVDEEIAGSISVWREDVPATVEEPQMRNGRPGRGRGRGHGGGSQSGFGIRRLGWKHD